METSASLANIAPALALAQSEFLTVAKSSENKFDHYKYANLEDYVKAVKPVLAKHGISIITQTDEVIELNDRPTKSGGLEHAVRVQCTTRLLHTSGEWLEVMVWGEGQDRADKAVYKAVTGARKYGLASALGLATSDDPEGDDGNGNAPKGPGNALPGDVQAFVDEYCDVMLKRGCKPVRSQSILRDAAKKKGVELAALPAGDRAKILEKVRAGEWDKYFLAKGKTANGKPQQSNADGQHHQGP